jgi:hypothetical protein
MDQLLSSARESSKTQPIIVLRSSDAVPGGTGKTMLACALAAELRGEDLFNGHHVLVEMRGAEDHTDVNVKQAVRNAKRHVIERCGLSLVDENDGNESESRATNNEKQLDRVYRVALSTVGVLIIDDVWNEAPVNALLLLDDVTMPRDQPRCAIVTSRNNIILACCVVRKIGVVPSDSAILMLKQYATNSRFSDDELVSVAEACGYIPLSLSLVGGAMAAVEDLTIAEMLQSLIPVSVEDAMGASLRWSYRALDSTLPTVLQQTASFPFSFTREAFEFAFGKDRSVLLSTLLNRGFLTLSVRGSSMLYSMHDVTRAFVRSCGDKDDIATWKVAVQRYYCNVVQQCEDNYSNPSSVQEAIRDFKAEVDGIQWVMRCDVIDEHLQFSDCADGVVRLLVPATDRIALFEKLRVHCEKQFGGEHQHTLRAKRCLAIALSKLSRHDDAVLLMRGVLCLQERKSGAEHCDTLSTKCNLAVILSKQGQHEEAAVYFRELLPVQVRTLGAEHHDTLVTKHKFALTLMRQKKYADAVTLYRDLLSARVRVLGTDHRDTLATQNNLAWALRDNGIYEEAGNIYRESLHRQERVLGAEHPHTLWTRHDLAVMLRDSGDRDSAESILSELRPIVERALGVDHALMAAVATALVDCSESNS